MFGAALLGIAFAAPFESKLHQDKLAISTRPTQPNRTEVLLANGITIGKFQAPHNSNWDYRGHLNMTVKSMRTVLFVRHGQYETKNYTPVLNKELDFLINDPKYVLTEKGKQQARLTGSRLASLLEQENLLDQDGLAVTIYSSDLSRALQTSSTIRDEIDKAVSRINAKNINVRYQVNSMLREGCPSILDPRPNPDSDLCKSDSDVWGDGPRIEGAFQTLVHRIDHNQEMHEGIVKNGSLRKVDIFVAHGNVLGYFIGRLFNPSVKSWKFDFFHTGITRLEIRNDGAVKLESLSEVDHLPDELVTRS